MPSPDVRFRVAIPARYASSRLPGKPLRVIAGRTMIEHVYRTALASGAREVVIATDDQRIREVAERFGADVCMTASDHLSGTDRLAEVATLRGWADDDIVVNLQGDEPLMPPALMGQVAAGLANHPDAGLATLCAPIHIARDVFDPHLVKVVMDARGYALYFSRAPIPYHRDRFLTGTGSDLPEQSDYFRHIGLYAYRAAILRDYPRLPSCRLERTESLEQLRALWNGIRIHVQEAAETPPVGVDTEQDLARVEAFLAGGGRAFSTLQATGLGRRRATVYGDSHMVRVLFVCMGNICRSPMAEGVFRRMLEEAGLADKVYVDSAGTHSYHTGSAPDRRSRQAASRRGVNISAVRARTVLANDLELFDYLLAMDRKNYDRLRALCAVPEHREKVRLLMDYAPDSPEREVPDPYYGGAGGFERVMDLLEEAAQGLIRDLRERYRL